MLFFKRKISAADRHLVQHKWSQLDKISDLHKKIYEAFSIFKYTLSKVSSGKNLNKDLQKLKNKLSNRQELMIAIQTMQKISDNEVQEIDEEVIQKTIPEFKKALQDLKILR